MSAQQNIFQSMTSMDLQMAGKRTGAELRDKGIKQSIDNAGTPWKEKALKFVLSYPGDEFMTEDVRQYAYRKGLEKPPSERAWGSIILRARKMGWVKFLRYDSVDNPKAHKTPATVWGRV